MWKQVLAPALLLAAPQQCFAQWIAIDDNQSLDEADGVAPKNFTRPGGAENVARMLMGAMRIQRYQRDRCWKMGCLVIVNETRGYDVIGFYVEPRRRRPGASEWGRNLFDAPLFPRKATLAYKDGDAAACNHPVRFELRHRVTKERLTVDGTANLCSTPKADSLLRIKVLEPQVIWDDEAPAKKLPDGPPAGK
ncbi:MAG: hypothetical protein EOP61_14120 [Sphingomonadales bacterium]|nr:MAG: hypothetical protein EOP61_14120 [Sphingomonadales bacterium]